MENGVTEPGWRPLCAAETQMVNRIIRHEPASGGLWLSLMAPGADGTEMPQVTSFCSIFDEIVLDIMKNFSSENVG